MYFHIAEAHSNGSKTHPTESAQGNLAGYVLPLQHWIVTGAGV